MALNGIQLKYLLLTLSRKKLGFQIAQYKIQKDMNVVIFIPSDLFFIPYITHPFNI